MALAVFIMFIMFSIGMFVCYKIGIFSGYSTKSQCYQRGVKCFHDNDMKGTIRNLNKYFELGGKNPKCHEYLSIAYKTQKQFTKANEHASMIIVSKSISSKGK